MTAQEFTDRVLARETRLYQTARAILRQEADREDAVQAAVAKAWEKRTALRDEHLFDTWLTRILINECRQILRAQKRVVPMERIPEQASDARPDAGEADAALDALPQRLRLPTVLFYTQGYPISDIAAMLRVPQGTIKSRLHEARKALRMNIIDQREAWRE